MENIPFRFIHYLKSACFLGQRRRTHSMTGMLGRPLQTAIVLPKAHKKGPTCVPVEPRVSASSNLTATHPLRRELLHDTVPLWVDLDDLRSTKIMREMRDDLRLKGLLADIAALEEVRKLYPTLETSDEWDDFDGAFLIHSTINALRNVIEDIKWKMGKRSYAGKMRNWLTSLMLRARKHRSTAQMLRSDAEGQSSRRRVSISMDAAKQALHLVTAVTAVLVDDDASDETEEVVMPSEDICDLLSYGYVRCNSALASDDMQNTVSNIYRR